MPYVFGAKHFQAPQIHLWIFPTKPKKKNLCPTQHRQYIASSSPTQLSTKKKPTPSLPDTHQTPGFHIITVKSRGSPPKKETRTQQATQFDPYTTQQHQATFPENPGPVPHIPNRRHH